MRWRVNDYDYQCEDCESSVIMRGHLKERPDRDQMDLGYRLSAQANRASLYVTPADGVKVSVT